MDIKKQIILNEKDYERLVNDANFCDEEIKNRVIKALTTDMVFSFDFDISKKSTGNIRIESAAYNSEHKYHNIVKARDKDIHDAVYTAIYNYLEKSRKSDSLSVKDWIMFISITLYVFTTGFVAGWLIFN